MLIRRRLSARCASVSVGAVIGADGAAIVGKRVHCWVSQASRHGLSVGTSICSQVPPDRMSVVQGKSVSVRVDHGGPRIIRKHTTSPKPRYTATKSKRVIN